MTRVVRLAALVAVAVFAVTAFGQDMTKVTNTPHNLNNWPGLTIDTPSGLSQVCLPCHVPHNAYPDPDGTVLEVLWNHEETGETFDMYTTRSGQQGGQPESSSKMCLSCHDGVTAIDSYGGNFPGTINLSGRPSAIGEDGDLTDDHPIGIVYPGGDGYNDPGGFDGVILVTIGGEDRVECTSCHEPHNNGLGNFLRRTLDESAICLECHDK